MLPEQQEQPGSWPPALFTSGLQAEQVPQPPHPAAFLDFGWHDSHVPQPPHPAAFFALG
jgi:hypothetical protein